jgi:hypothetical protein
VLRTTRHRFTLPLAALLLVVQALGGGAVALAHADEPTRVPAAFEAHHSASCPVVHDATRCALCQYAGLRVSPGPAVAHLSAATRPARHAIVEPRSHLSFTRHLTAPPRAPPVLY